MKKGEQGTMASKSRGARNDRGAFDLAMVERLCAVIEQETTDLKSLERVDYEASNARKAQGLLELNRLLHAADDRRTPELIDGLRRLEMAIIDNQKLLLVHLSAANAITGLIARAVRESQSDGTYGVDGGPSSDT